MGSTQLPHLKTEGGTGTKRNEGTVSSGCAPERSAFMFPPFSKSASSPSDQVRAVASRSVWLFIPQAGRLRRRPRSANAAPGRSVQAGDQQSADRRDQLTEKCAPGALHPTRGQEEDTGNRFETDGHSQRTYSMRRNLSKSRPKKT
jgi:hypothetical protein